MNAKVKFCALLIAFVLTLSTGGRSLAAVTAPISGEIQSILLNNPADHWSGGSIVVGGQNVILPRNLLIDLPANRLTLTQIFEQAPAACVARGESGLAKTDQCNLSGTGGFATISATRTRQGTIIAGDVFIEKGIELLSGQVTFLNYAEGFFRLNGVLNDPNTGVMVRLNDPTGRHTIQQGTGCVVGNTVNCSPDPRFTLDPDNYTNVFSTGYPLCIPSTVLRTFTDVLGLGTTTAQALADGTGDVLCPATNRGAVVPEPPVADSRRFAPIKIGDTITFEGNFETINGVRFLSAHTSIVGRALLTQNIPTQPDYMFFDDVGIDAPGFQNQRARGLFIGFTTLAPTDILIWSLHRDPVTNEAHEFPLATTIGCDSAGGAGTCTNQGLLGAGANIFRIDYDIDFLTLANPKLNPCVHLNSDARMGTGFCPGGPTLTNMFSILSPVPHEVQGRTGHSLANPGLITIDIKGNRATNGQYLFPLGINLGGIVVPELVEINLDLINTPILFSGIPWNLDRRLSPGGCIDIDGDGVLDCEATPQPLDPFPWEELDPRTQANLPLGPYNDRHFTNSPLTSVRDRILSFVTDVGGGAFSFDGNNTILAWPPVSAPVAVEDFATISFGTPSVNINLAANDLAFGSTINPVSVAITGLPANGTVLNNADGTVTYTPNTGFIGTDTFSYTVQDTAARISNPGLVTVTALPAVPPTAINDSASVPFGGLQANIALTSNDVAHTDPIDSASVAITVLPANGTVVNNGDGTVTYTPNIGFSGIDTFTYTVQDTAVPPRTSNPGVVTVTVGSAVPIFADVPSTHFAFVPIQLMAAAGIAAGCGSGNFCPDNPVTRGQMAVFIESSLGNLPNLCAGLFPDANAAAVGSSVVCGFIERLAADGITGGCGAGNFCPNDPVTRGQMAVFIETAIKNPANACTGQFTDVTAADSFCGFIEKLAADAISGGCGGGNFCPNDPVTRAQMAVFIVAAPAPLLP